MYIGIIGAMEEELNKLASLITLEKEEVINNTVFKVGSIYDKRVVVCVCGEGKVNSSIASQIMINSYDLKCIINVGVAGSISKDVKMFDIVIANSVCQHDYDISSLGYERGLVLGIDTKYVKTSDKSKEIYEYLTLNSDVKVHYDSVATGDVFVAETSLINDIKSNFDVVAVDMESGSIGHVCLYNNIDYICMRAISDGSNCMEYRDFVDKVIDVLTDAFVDVLKNISL